MARSPDLKINTTIPDLISDIRRPQLIPYTGWHDINESGDRFIPFQNSWENSGADGAAPAGFYLSEDGEVRMRGKITGGLAETIVCTLPEEVCPEYVESFIVPVVGGGRAEIEVRPDGNVYVVYIQPAP